MRFKITLNTIESLGKVIPINYQYPLSAAIYKVLSKGDAEYASFLHTEGYGKGYKLFTFSDIFCPFQIKGDRLHLQSDELEFQVSFHMPKAFEGFIQGLFRSEQIDIGDYRSVGRFRVKSIETLYTELPGRSLDDFIKIKTKPISPLICGFKNERGNYSFLSPEDERFQESFIHTWREKIKATYDADTADRARLECKVVFCKNLPKSRLMTIKARTDAETKIRGFMNFELELQAEKRYIELLLGAGAGLYSAQGMGCLEVVSLKIFENNFNEKVHSKKQ